MMRAVILSEQYESTDDYPGEVPGFGLISARDIGIPHELHDEWVDNESFIS
jgi:hypothetical protein